MIIPLKPTRTAALAALLLSFVTAVTAQSDQPIPWHHLAYEVDSVPGIALSQARSLLSEEAPAQRVKVAVLDCGVDATHPALAGAIHTNLNEIEGNGIDDDGNGYIDDVIGWNFMVDSTGRSLNFARYEAHYFTHLYDSLEASGLPIPVWLKNLDMDLTRELAEEAQGYADDAWFYAELFFDFAMPFHDTFEEYPDNFEQIWFHRKAIGLNRAERKFLKFLMGEELTLWDFEYYVQEAWNYDQFWTNPDYNPRDPNEPDTGYGNNDASGGYEDHGTHVAGIICGGATDDGGPIGIANGLVDIIPVRMVPDGDELDKDVANAIRYAVDQGASIINMSFGKYVSSDPERVREALRYAAANDVLIVHAAGNEANDIDAFPFYPNPGRYRDVDSVFINVGASTSAYDDLLIAEFSNVGKRRVDLFAPGEDILSLGADHDYIDHSGTSMASPVVAGVAALLRAYFPEFTAAEIKDILLDSVHEPEFRVLPPGTPPSEVTFAKSMSKFCSSGGIVNARNAVLEARSQREAKAAAAVAAAEAAAFAAEAEANADSSSTSEN
jgi:subtilisin family serine protease